MARAASSEDTAHYIHLMNWVSCYKGASVFDYPLHEKIELIEKASMAQNRKHQTMRAMNPNYGKMWQKNLPYQNVTNLVDFALTESCRPYYTDHIFGQETSFQIQKSMADWISRSHTTINGGFTFDTETSLGIFLS